MGEPRWLSNDEQAAWRPLAELVLVLPSHLEESLRAYGLTFFEYTQLVVLSHAADQTMPMTELAHLANGSLSRTSHSSRRLEQRGLVARQQCPDDGRVTLVTLTDEGYQQLAKAAPSHVESVRRAIFDTLTPQQTKQLGQLATAILEHIAPNSPWVTGTNAALQPPTS